MIGLPFAPLLAHSWGWDEVLMFAVPLVLAFFGIRWAERRAAQRYAEGGEATEDGEPTEVP